MRLVVLLPALNEAEGIGRTLHRLPKDALATSGWELEVLVVDGASTDGTAQVAAGLGAKVLVEARRGYGRAYKSGLPHADGDVVVTADADDTYPLDELVDYLAAYQTRRLDFATVDRFAHLEKGSMSLTHRIGNRILSAAARLLFRVRLHDSQSGMWILSRQAIRSLPLQDMSDGMAFSQEIKLAAFRGGHLRAAELPGRYHPRVGQEKLVRWQDGPRNLWSLVKRRLRPGPLRKGSR